MDSKQIGWSLFLNKAETMFSYAFKKQMSQQLEARFNQFMREENFVKKHNFGMIVGLKDTKIIEKDGYHFILVEIITPKNFSRTFYAYWKTEENKNLLKVESLNENQIYFGWSKGFDVAYFREQAKENIVKEIKGKSLNFKLAFTPDLFPDLNFTFEFKKEPKSDFIDFLKKEILNTFKTSYTSELSKFEEKKYYLMIDFEATSFEKGIDQIEDFILKINEAKGSLNLKKLKIQ